MAILKEMYSERKDKVLNALIDRKGLQYLTDVASEALKNPLFINDVSGKILAKSKLSGHEEIWKELFPKGHMDSVNRKITENTGIMKRLMEEDIPIFGKFSYSRFRFLGCRIRDKYGVVAIATVVEINPLCEDDSDLLLIICKSILFELLYHERTAMQTIPYFGILKDIIETTASINEIRERCLFLNLVFPKEMRLIGIKFSANTNNSLSLYFYREMLMSSIPSCYCIIYDEMLLLIISQKYFNKSLLNIIKDILGNYEIRVGISSRFADILDIKNAFQELIAIQSINKKLNLEKLLTFYEDIQIYHFIELALKEYDLNKFCLPVLKQIEEYDIRYGTLLKHSLEGYLESGRNTQKAADHLYIHKNTLYYRLKRIEELFDINLNDENSCFNLQFSLRMQRMAK